MTRPATARRRRPRRPGRRWPTRRAVGSGWSGCDGSAWWCAVGLVGVDGRCGCDRLSGASLDELGVHPEPANQVANLGGSVTSYTDSGLAAGTYHYVVVAADAAGNSSPPSAQATGTAFADTTAPTRVGDRAGRRFVAVGVVSGDRDGVRRRRCRARAVQARRAEPRGARHERPVRAQLGHAQRFRRRALADRGRDDAAGNRRPRQRSRSASTTRPPAAASSPPTASRRAPGPRPPTRPGPATWARSRAPPGRPPAATAERSPSTASTTGSPSPMPTTSTSPPA